MVEPVCIVPAGDRTGEGAVWHAEEKAVFWADITRFLIHRYDPDAGTLCSCGETVRNAIYVWDYDAITATIANERPFFSDFGRGLPDGSAMDRDGYLWNARYGGGCVVRVGRDGKIDHVVDMPVGNVTTCTFGGTDLRTLYITTAQVALSPEERRQQPLAGGLFRARISVPGLPQGIVSHGL